MRMVLADTRHHRSVSARVPHRVPLRAAFEPLVIIGRQVENGTERAGRRTKRGHQGERMATCPECDAELDIEDDDLEEMEAGDPWDCEACGSRLRVASLDPLEFDSDEDDESEDDDEEGNGAGEEG